MKKIFLTVASAGALVALAGCSSAADEPSAPAKPTTLPELQAAINEVSPLIGAAYEKNGDGVELTGLVCQALDEPGPDIHSLLRTVSIDAFNKGSDHSFPASDVAEYVDLVIAYCDSQGK